MFLGHTFISYIFLIIASKSPYCKMIKVNHLYILIIFLISLLKVNAQSEEELFILNNKQWLIEKNNLFGINDKDGKEAIPPIYSSIKRHYFKHNLVKCQTGKCNFYYTLFKDEIQSFSDFVYKFLP